MACRNVDMDYFQLEIIDNYNNFMNSVDLADQMYNVIALTIGVETKSGGGLSSCLRLGLLQQIVTSSTIICMMRREQRMKESYHQK